MFGSIANVEAVLGETGVLQHRRNEAMEFELMAAIQHAHRHAVPVRYASDEFEILGPLAHGPQHIRRP